jgi:acetyl esterase/lipase
VVFNPNVAFTVPLLTGIERLACAVRFARAEAPDYGGDPNEITIVGISAGAASAVVIGLAGDDFDAGCVVSAGSALPDAVVAFEGPYEFATTAYGTVIDHTSLKNEDQELLEAIDPYSHIGRNPDLQVRLIHGVDVDDDWWDIRPEESTELHQTLADAGYDVELITVEGADHVDLHIHTSAAFAIAVQQVKELAHSPSQ